MTGKRQGPSLDCDTNSFSYERTLAGDCGMSGVCGTMPRTTHYLFLFD